jgi:glycine/D-amino acid oxidase-like deaminating enzyme/nitrite reductase/ring-hydroxylating ferredoxin subunit
MSNLSDVFSSRHEAYWILSTKETGFPPLKDDLRVDVAIIGGGIVGITAAYLLKKKGYKVAVLESDKILHGTTGHTTAKLTSQHGLIYHKLISKFGEEKAKEYADANESSIQFVSDIIKENGIECNYEVCPSYVYTSSKEYIKKIEEEVEAASKLGINSAYVEKIPLPFDTICAVRFDNQAKFHPLKYLLALSSKITEEGSDIFEHTTVVDIKQEHNSKSEVITRDGKKVTSDFVIIASHYPCYDGLGMYFARMYIEKSYLIGLKIKDKFSEAIFINAESPTRSLRTANTGENEILLVGGENHITGSEKDTNIHYESLANFSKENFNLDKILYRWSTQDCMTVDGVPYVGKLTSKTEDIFVATGFGKWGMTNGTAAARILTDHIIKGESPWQEVYNPSRFDVLAASGKFIAHNLDVANNYIGGKIASVPKDIKLKSGEAEVIKTDEGKMGAYKDENGKLHLVNITCTHLGCELVWNDAEKTWDCPCHGSRFTFDGENVEGPAFIPLNHQGEGQNEKDANIK